ncbi:MAG: YggS family pyridoxal phosphate-dependent enzyme, partial [Lentisphaeria bacterium]|nr:YggS family pyridoxal phosphate-dependent enzyme [Lentisphaeria bacterium]
MSCAENYRSIIEELKKNNRSGVTLLPVSKTVSAEVIRELYDIGVREFAENRIEVLTPKAETLPKDIQWHFIGRLQSNKVRKVLKAARFIHSVDSIELVERIDRIAGEEKCRPV